MVIVLSHTVAQSASITDIFCVCMFSTILGMFSAAAGIHKSGNLQHVDRLVVA